LDVVYPYIEGLYINENWAGIPLGMSIESLIATGWSDDVHMHTMLHERGQYIGAGVTVSCSTAYPCNRDTRKSTKYIKISQTATVQRVIESSAPSLIEAEEENRGSDMDLYYLLFSLFLGLG